EQRFQVGGEGVVVETGGRPARLAEAASVVADHSVAGREQLRLLALPRVRVQGVAVDQDDRLPAPVVLVVDLDVGVVLGTDLDVRHSAPFRSGCEGFRPGLARLGLRSPPFDSRRIDSIVPDVSTRRCRRRPSARIPQTVGRAYAPVAFITTGVQTEHSDYEVSARNLHGRLYACRRRCLSKATSRLFVSSVRRSRIAIGPPLATSLLRTASGRTFRAGTRSTG